MNMLDAKAIKAIRKSLGMTQTQFAAALGKSYSAVCSWESGKRHPTWKAMERINRIANSKNDIIKVPVNGKSRKRAS